MAAAATDHITCTTQMSSYIPPEGRVVVDWSPDNFGIELHRSKAISLVVNQKGVFLPCISNPDIKVEMPAWKINGTLFVFADFSAPATDSEIVFHITSRSKAHLVMMREWGSHRKYSVVNSSGDVIVLAPQIATGQRGHRLKAQGKVVEVGKQISVSSPIQVTAPQGHVRSAVDMRFVEQIQRVFSSVLDQEPVSEDRIGALLMGLAACYHAAQIPDGSSARREYPFTAVLDFFGIPHQPPKA